MKPSPVHTPPTAPASRRGRVAAAAVVAALASPVSAFAQGATQGGLGAQIVAMAAEFSDAFGTGANTAMYIAALLVFIGSLWAFWKSRQPQGRESGYVALGVCGLLIAGAFASGPSLIGKAAQSASGAAASVSNSAQVVQFQ